MNYRKQVSVAVLLMAALGAGFSAPTAQAQTEYKGWTWRAWAGTGTFNFETDNEFPALGIVLGADESRNVRRDLRG